METRDVRFSREEQETTITYEAATGEWNFYTCVTSHINSFLKNALIDKGKIETLTEWEGKPTSIQFSVENALVTKSFLRKKRVLSEKQKQALREGREKALERF